MTRRIAAWFMFVALAGAIAVRAGSRGEEFYGDGMKAVAARDFKTALAKLEAAVAADPESVRYASEYRQAAITTKEFDRAIAFLQEQASAHPKSANILLNFGFAYVDKIPAAGSITQVILANTALTHFTKSIEIRPTWIGYYTRGNSYLYWPKVFNRTANAAADLESGLKIQQSEPKRSYHVRVYVSLGDAYWKMDDLAKARQIWTEGLRLFPDSEPLKKRLSLQGDDLRTLEEEAYDFTKRVDTNLRQLWENE